MNPSFSFKGLGLKYFIKSEMVVIIYSMNLDFVEEIERGDGALKMH
jgi:hypothetical protein